MWKLSVAQKMNAALAALVVAGGHKHDVIDLLLFREKMRLVVRPAPRHNPRATKCTVRLCYKASRGIPFNGFLRARLQWSKSYPSSGANFSMRSKRRLPAVIASSVNRFAMYTKGKQWPNRWAQERRGDRWAGGTTRGVGSHRPDPVCRHRG